MVLVSAAVVLGTLGHAGLGGGGVAVALWFALSFAVITLYDVFFEVLNAGRTPGKLLNGLRVVRVSGHPVTFVPSLIRNAIRPIDFLPSAYLLGAVVILATRKNQRIGDAVAGTLVVRDRRRLAVAAGDAVVRPVDPGDPSLSWDTSAVTADELAAVRQFLERRTSIDFDVRRELARTLAERLRPKVVGAPADVQGEQFLVALVKAKLARAR